MEDEVALLPLPRQRSKATKRKATGARVWWKDYVCPKKVGQPVKRKCTPAKATVKRVRK